MTAQAKNLVQPQFDSRIYSLAFPLTGTGGGTIYRGYLIQYQALPSYTDKCVFHYQYNPSTVSSDYNIADPTAQAALNFPVPGDTAQLAVPLNQTVSWSVMFDRTYELNGAYNSDATPKKTNPSSNDPSVIGVEADVLQLKAFTGMMTNYSYGTASASGLSNNQNYAVNTGIMQLVMCYAYFGNSVVGGNTSYFGYINEWSVQYTHWTQYNIPMRCVIDISFTMMPPPNQNTSTPSKPSTSNDSWFVPVGNGTVQVATQPGTAHPVTLNSPGIAGR